MRGSAVNAGMIRDDGMFLVFGLRIMRIDANCKGIVSELETVGKKLENLRCVE